MAVADWLRGRRHRHRIAQFAAPNPPPKEVSFNFTGHSVVGLKVTVGFADAIAVGGLLRSRRAAPSRPAL